MSFTFVDLFAGCGGLSLGLFKAGGEGLFAIEKSSDAFESLRANFLAVGSQYSFTWPRWLPKTEMNIRSALRRFHKQLANMRGRVDAVVGGPPCQGFSVYGLRRPSDARNGLYASQLKMVVALKPKVTVIENVPGIAHRYRKAEAATTLNRARKKTTYIERICVQLDKLGYAPVVLKLNAASLGIPQRRARLFIVAVQKEFADCLRAEFSKGNLRRQRREFLQSQGLRPGQRVSLRAALGDLEILRCGTTKSTDSKGFLQVDYKGPRTKFQHMMHKGLSPTAPPSSIRLPNHSPTVVDRFHAIQKKASPGKNLPDELLRELKTSKHRIHLLSPDKPSPTITTLPDDFVHYSEPRVLTVREFARIQTFPDRHIFLGPYTSGGDRRGRECPRYTQVANAVPVRMAQYLGKLIDSLVARIASEGETAERCA